MAKFSSRSIINLPLSVANGGMPAIGSNGQMLGVVSGAAAYTNISSTWTKYTMSYTSFQTAGLTNAVPLFTLAAKGYIHRVIVVISTPFAGTTTCTLSIGKVGSLTQYVVASDARAAANTTYLDSMTGALFQSISATTGIVINAISTIENLSVLSAGVADVYVMSSVLP